jgi:hypothetical protein
VRLESAQVQFAQALAENFLRSPASIDGAWWRYSAALRVGKFRHTDEHITDSERKRCRCTMSGEFDPARHKIVAIVSDPADPEHGQHLHVTVQEFRQVVREIEREIPVETGLSAEVQDTIRSVDALLRLVLQRLDELDGRISTIEQVKVQLVQGVVA